MTQLEADRTAATEHGSLKRRSARKDRSSPLLAVAGDHRCSVGFVAVEASALWQEWSMLQSEVARRSATPSSAFTTLPRLPPMRRPPRSGIAMKATRSLLWSRWEDRVGHQVVSIHPRRDRPDARSLGRPRTSSPGPSTIPWSKPTMATIWQRIPPDAQVVGYTLEGHEVRLSGHRPGQGSSGQ